MRHKEVGLAMLWNLNSNSDNVRQELLKGYLTGVIVEANLKLVEYSRAAEEVKTNSKAL